MLKLNTKVSSFFSISSFAAILLTQPALSMNKEEVSDLPVTHTQSAQATKKDLKNWSAETMEEGLPRLPNPVWGIISKDWLEFMSDKPLLTLHRIAMKIENSEAKDKRKETRIYQELKKALANALYGRAKIYHLSCATPQCPVFMTAAAQLDHEKALLCMDVNSGYSPSWLPFLNVQDFADRTRQAHNYLQKAVALGYAGAKYKLGRMHLYGVKDHNDNEVMPKDIDKAITFFKSALPDNDVKATEFMAICYESGSNGFRKNYKKALDLWEKAYDLGSLHASRSLIPYYRDGLGAPPNTEKLIVLLEKLAKEDNDESLLTLALLHIKDEEVKQDFEKAEKLLSRIEGASSPMIWIKPLVAFTEDFFYRGLDHNTHIPLDCLSTKRQLLELITKEKEKKSN
jgi:TPR repeat protein